MSALGEKIRIAINNIIDLRLKGSELKPSISCIVKSVSGDSLTGLMTCDCAPTDGTAIIEDVQLCANFNNDTTQVGFLLIPSVGSIVTVSFKSKTDAFVSMVSIVDKIFLNGNDYGGIVEVIPLVAKINKLESDINSLKAVISTIITTGISSPLTPVTNGTLGASLSSYPIIPLNLTLKSELENINVVHGEGNLV